VYVNLTTKQAFWIWSCLASVKAHFKKASRYIVNMEVPRGWSEFRPIVLSDGIQREDMTTVNAVSGAAAASGHLSTQYIVQPDTGSRFVVKLALAVGYRVFGRPFLDTEHAKILRRAFREADPIKRATLPIPGTGYLSAAGDPQMRQLLHFAGAWVLLLTVVSDRLALSIISPSGKIMNVLVSDDPSLIPLVVDTYRDGVIWLTVPALRNAVGPLCLLDYLEHQTGSTLYPELCAIVDKRVEFDDLPPC